MNRSESLLDRLQAVWGYSKFRPPQQEIIETILAQQDALIVLPTGGGKSLCFQLPALMQSGLTIVVSPLVALMENQVQELRQRRLPGALLHSELSARERSQVFQLLKTQQLRLLYLSPETLLSAAVWQCLCDPDLKINTLVLDEAHCLTQWGETFRPAYYRLGSVRSALLQHKPAGTRIAIAAFTATADPTTQDTIQRILQLENPTIFRFNPYRPNLALQVQSIWTPHQRRQKLLRVIQSQFGSGLVYVRSRRDSEELATWLQQQGYQTAAYHSGLRSIERRAIEQAWLGGSFGVAPSANRLQFVVCTCAFGVGINKPSTRWVVHYHAPLLLSEYVQEIGRAGRDGNPAIAVLFKSSFLDSDDRQRQTFFETQERSQRLAAQTLARKLPQKGTIEDVARQFRNAAESRSALIALSLLHSAKQLIWQDPFHYEIQSTEKLPQHPQLSSTRFMQNYLNTKTCRWQYLLRSFGFEAHNFFCGTCDRCQP